MKTLALIIALTTTALAQLPAPAQKPKPPIGVPSDAQFFNGHWFKVYLEKGSWTTARDKCKTLGGHLVIVPDAATWEFVKGLTCGAQSWIGATDEVTPGIWKWVDGSPITFTAWFLGQPDNAGGVEHYAAIYKSAWADVPKGGVIGKAFAVQCYVCEW